MGMKQDCSQLYDNYLNWIQNSVIFRSLGHYIKE